MSDFTLRRHRLRHLGALKVTPEIFQSTFGKNCSMNSCSGSCCAGGVWVDLLERDRIVAQAARIQEHMEPTQEKDPARWFDSERLKSGDFPSGEAEGTEVYNDACVFLDSSKRCVLQKASDATTGQLKPFYCFAFPITIEEGELQLDEGKDSRCCLIEAGGVRSVLDLCEEELRHVLGDEGLQEFRSLAGSQSRALHIKSAAGDSCPPDSGQ